MYVYHPFISVFRLTKITPAGMVVKDLQDIKE